MFSPGDQRFWKNNPPRTEIFEQFGPIMENWPGPPTFKCILIISADTVCRSQRMMYDRVFQKHVYWRWHY